MLQLISTTDFRGETQHLESISNVQIATDVIPKFVANTVALVPTLAALLFFYAGFMLVTATSEDRVKKAQLTVLSTLSAMLIFGLITPIQTLLENIITNGISALASTMSLFIGDILNFAFTTLNQIATVVAIFMLILTGYQMILSFGDSGNMKDARQSATGIFIALIVIGLSRTFTSEIFQLSTGGDLQFSADSAISFIAMLLNTALSLAGITAIAMIIYGAYKLLFAGEGDSSATKKTIQHAIIGLVIVMLSLSLVNIIYSVLLPA